MQFNKTTEMNIQIGIVLYNYNKNSFNNFTYYNFFTCRNSNIPITFLFKSYYYKVNFDYTMLKRLYIL